MNKIPTVFKRDPENMRRVLDEVTPGCEWVLAHEGIGTRKYDGTCVMLDAPHGLWWARREVKPGKTPPENFWAISTDETTGKTVGWEPIAQSPFAKFHAEALGHVRSSSHPGTYELMGPKINGNPELLPVHVLVAHRVAERVPGDSIMAMIDFCRDHGWEGIVWHHPAGRMAKLKVRDFS